MSSLLLRIRTALSDRYEIDRQVGEGGMAVVFLATDRKHRRPVALKVLKPDLALALGPKRFLEEIAIAARLAHPHILPLHDSGEADGLLYYVMPYVEGESLRARLDRERQLPIEEAIRIVEEVGSALGHAHDQGIVHRDIKPENVLLTGGHAVVSDFGIARAVDAAGAERLTQTGLSVGTPTYMSPEQASGDRLLDHRSDIYSLGCLAYEMLGGEPPFTGANPLAVIARHTLDPVPPLGTLRRGLPEAVVRAIEKALAKTPADRFPTAAAFTDALRQAVAENPFPERNAARTRWRRLSIAAAVTSVALLALAAGYLPNLLNAGGRTQIRSLAVLPPDNLTGGPDEEYFAAGIHEALIGELASIGSLRVISRRTMMQYQNSGKTVPEIARELNVSGVLETSLSRSSDQVRLRVQLVRALPREQSLWSETYERGLHDAWLVHGDVARAVAEQVRVSLTPGEIARLQRQREVDPEVYEAYLRGMFELAKPDVADRRRGLDYLHAAVDQDPGNARAYAGLAMGYASLGHDDAVIPDALPRARAAALRAVALDPQLAEAHAALAEIKVYYERDWEGGEQAFLRALALNPGLALTRYHYSWYLLLFDRVEEAIAEHERAQELDPLTLIHTSDLGILYWYLGRFDDAMREIRKALAQNPDYPRGLWGLGLALLAEGRAEEAIAAHERLVEVAPRWVWVLGQTYALSGREADARRIAAELEAQPANAWFAFGLAVIYSALDDRDSAFRWLAYSPSHAWVPWVRVGPDFLNLRDDPRYAELLRRFDLPPSPAAPARFRASGASERRSPWAESSQGGSDPDPKEVPHSTVVASNR